MLCLRHPDSVYSFCTSGLEPPITNSQLTRILIVDDFADWQRFVLEKIQENTSFCVVGVASDGLEAVAQAQKLQPDLILLDINLPKLNGIEAARQIRKVAPESRILFLCQVLDVEVAQAALDAGGHGYVLKLDAEAELFTAMEAIMLGRKFVSHGLQDHVVHNSITRKRAPEKQQEQE